MNKFQNQMRRRKRLIRVMMIKMNMAMTMMNMTWNLKDLDLKGQMMIKEMMTLWRKSSLTGQ